MRQLHVHCTVPGCGRRHKARGYCPTHYAQFFRQQPITEAIRSRVREQPEECSEEECSDPVKAKGLCKAHYQRLLRHGHTRYRDRKRAPGVCTINSCDSHVYAKMLCHGHYIKQRKWQAYGVDAARYQEMLFAQKGFCAICEKPERRPDKASGKLKDLAVDHCHRTNRVRALLCSNCNTALGLFQDDPELLAKAARYVLSFRAAADLKD